jgi:glycerol-3-phosphate dehydrogenase
MGFGWNDRDGLVDRLQTEEFDIIVIGGGITGAGIVRDAALRGLKVALVEKDDFSSGTSSRSSKLVHGGLRYLEQYKIGLVFESTHERARLFRLARHVVRPLSFLLPVFRGQRHGLWFMNMGLWLYDLLGMFKNYRMHKRYNPSAVRAMEPGLKTEGLTGALQYYDGITDDTRLTIENILSAVRAGAVPLSRIEARGAVFQGERLHAVTVKDLVNGREFPVRTRAVVCAAGPWTEAVLGSLDARGGPRLRPTKGTHIVLPRELLPVSQAVVMLAPRDDRVVFAIPWHGATVVGTTDTDYEGSFDDVHASSDDVEYLLAAVRVHFPGFRGSAGDVIGTWSGLRPLLRTDGVSESDISREHIVSIDPRGIVSIAGGKLTTFRLMAIEAIEAVTRFLEGELAPSVTRDTPLPYCDGMPDEASFVAQRNLATTRFGIPDDCAWNLVGTYGVEAARVMAPAETDPSLRKPLAPGWPFLRAEVVYAATDEMAGSLIDALCRRMPVFFLLKGEVLEAVARDAADLMGNVIGWDPVRKQNEVQAVLRKNRDHMACVQPAVPPA